MTRRSNREEIDHTNDTDAGHETHALLPSTSEQNLTRQYALSTVRQNSQLIDNSTTIDLETDEALSPVHQGRPVSDAGSHIFHTASVTKMLCLAILMGGILGMLKTDELKATFIMTLVSLGTIVVADGIATPLAIAMSNVISNSTKLSMIKITITNLGLWTVNVLLTALTTFVASSDNPSFSPWWTGGFALAAVALEVITTMCGILIFATDQYRLAPVFGQRGSSTHFQLNVSIINNPSNNPGETSALTETNQLMTAVPK